MRPIDQHSLCQLHRSVGHDRCKLSRTCEKFPICDDKITENGRCVIKITGIHCSTKAQCQMERDIQWMKRKISWLVQSASIGMVGHDRWHYVLLVLANHRGVTSVQRHSLTSFGILLDRRDFPFSEFKGHPRRSTLGIGGNRRLCPYSMCCVSNFGEDNVINGSLLDTYIGTKIEEIDDELLNW